MKELTITVRDEIADRFLKLNDQEKKDLSEMISILMEDKRTLRQVMDDISEYAQQQGLTPEILEQLLKKEWLNLVIDNNVIISASLFKNSVPDRAFEKAKASDNILSSKEIYDELKEVVHRSKFDKYFKEADRKILLTRYLAETVSVIVSHQVSLCRDPDDNKYLELALSGKADRIITGDPDLLVLNPFENIPIITPKEFLDSISTFKWDK